VNIKQHIPYLIAEFGICVLLSYSELRTFNTVPVTPFNVLLFAPGLFVLLKSILYVGYFIKRYLHSPSLYRGERQKFHREMEELVKE
jgi:hypothetical protein